MKFKKYVRPGKPIFLPDIAFDAIHFSALAYGGVGGGANFGGRHGDPLCLYGHAAALNSMPTKDGHITYQVMKATGYSVVSMNDTTVRRLGVRRRGKRVPWDVYRKAMNIHPVRERKLREE